MMIRRRTFATMAAAAGIFLVAPARGFAQAEATTATEPTPGLDSASAVPAPTTATRSVAQISPEAST